jgi:hypothetical protein
MMKEACRSLETMVMHIFNGDFAIELRINKLVSIMCNVIYIQFNFGVCA